MFFKVPLVLLVAFFYRYFLKLFDMDSDSLHYTVMFTLNRLEVK